MTSNLSQLTLTAVKNYLPEQSNSHLLKLAISIFIII